MMYLPSWPIVKSFSGFHAQKRKKYFLPQEAITHHAVIKQHPRSLYFSLRQDSGLVGPAAYF